MAKAKTPEELAFLDKWRVMQEVHDAELAVMTDEQAERHVLAVLSGNADGWRNPERWATTGLVEQQRLFARARKS